MPLEEKNGQQFVQYVQTLREVKDSYTGRKLQKDRHKHIKWLTIVLENKEVILTFTHEGNTVTEFVTLMPPKDVRVLEEFPEAPLTKEIIHDEEVLEDQYVRCYLQPSWDPMLVHVDDIICWTTTQDGMNELNKEFEKRLYAL